MGDERGTALSSILVGDLVSPHSPSDRFEYVASVFALDDRLVQASLPDVLGGYPSNPETLVLTAEQVDALSASARETEELTTLLALLGEDTFVLAPGFGAANLRAYISANDPDLLAECGLDEPPESSANNIALVLLIGFAIVVLIGLGAWIAVRVVSGY